MWPEIIGGFDGVDGILLVLALAGETYSYTFETAINPDWDLNNIEAIGLLLADNGFVINAAKSEHLVAVNQVEVQSFKLYPNPAKSFVNIESENIIQSISVYNNMGQMVLETQVGGTQYQLNTTVLNNGVYFDNIINNKGVSSKTLIVE